MKLRIIICILCALPVCSTSEEIYNSLEIQVFEFAKSHVIVIESKYPCLFVAKRQCHWRKENVVATDQGYYQMQSGDEPGLKSAVAKCGPIVVGISGYQHGFKFSKSGWLQSTVYNISVAKSK